MSESSGELRGSGAPSWADERFGAAGIAVSTSIPDITNPEIEVEKGPGEGGVASIKDAMFTSFGVSAGLLAEATTGAGYRAPAGERLKIMGECAKALLRRTDLDPETRKTLEVFVRHHNLYNPGEHSEQDRGRNGMLSRWARKAEAFRRRHPWAPAISPFLFNLDRTGPGGRPDGRVEASEVMGWANRLGNFFRNGVTIGVAAVTLSIVVPSCAVGYKIGEKTAPERLVDRPVTGLDVLLNSSTVSFTYDPGNPSGYVLVPEGTNYIDLGTNATGTLATDFAASGIDVSATTGGLSIEGIGRPPEGMKWMITNISVGSRPKVVVIPVPESTGLLPAYTEDRCPGGGSLITSPKDAGHDLRVGFAAALSPGQSIDKIDPVETC